MKKLLLALGLTISLGMAFLNVSAYASPNRDNKIISSREDIRSFQKANGLRVDGIVGVKTKAVMAEKGYSMAYTSPNTTINSNKIISSREDIRSFQKANGLRVDGIVGVKTKAVMVEKGYSMAAKKRNVSRSNTRTTVAAKVAPAHNPFIKCQFLFWELECKNPEYTENAPYDSTQRTVTRTKSQPNNVASGYNNIYRATKYVGLHGKTNRQTVKAIISKPFDSPIDPVRTPWCAAFANAILRENNYDTTDSLMARSFLTYGVATRRPSQGDIVVLKRGRSSHTGHVGFYVNTVTIDGQTYVAVLGGNQGKAINIAHYPVNKVLAYRKPVTAS